MGRRLPRFPCESPCMEKQRTGHCSRFAGLHKKRYGISKNESGFLAEMMAMA